MPQIARYTTFHLCRIINNNHDHLQLMQGLCEIVSEAFVGQSPTLRLPILTSRPVDHYEPRRQSASSAKPTKKLASTVHEAKMPCDPADTPKHY